MSRVVVLHPDLGIGGAERLIVDAAMALIQNKHQVEVYTGYHDRSRCFDETRDGRLNVTVIGRRIPRSIFGRFIALLAYIKMIYIAIYIIVFTKNKYDFVLCDQVSACIPIFKILQLFKKQLKIVFYCHFPDQLLTTRESLLKAIYRKPIDFFEEWSTSLADKIIVNSNFTSNMVKQTFRSLRNRNLIVLYPCVDVTGFSMRKKLASLSACSLPVQECIGKVTNVPGSYLFLSLNRFERKKDIRLAIESLQQLQLKLDRALDGSKKPINPKQIFLVVAGGYDDRLPECIEYYRELADMVSRNENLVGQVIFIKSPHEIDKLILLRSCDAVVYTPENEHFGIVPLEAMAMSKPVIASRSGGPLETIVDTGTSATGLLCDHNSESFAVAMLSLCQNKEQSQEMGSNGFERVKSHFSKGSFEEQIDRIFGGQTEETNLFRSWAD